MRYARTAIALPILCSAGLAIWLVTFVRFGPFGYGYDSGLYRRYLLEPFVSFPNTPVPGLDHTVFLPRILLDLVHFFVRNPDVALYGTYLGLGIAGVISVYFFTKHYTGNRGAVAATLLYILSAVQFSAQQAFFFKQAAALPLFLFGVLAFETRRYALGACLGILIVLTHQTSSVLYIVLAGTGFLTRAFFTRSIPLAYAFSVTAVAAAYLLLHPHVAQKVASPPVSLFISPSEYLLWSVPLFAFVVLGVRSFLPVAKRNHVLLGSLGILLLFVILRLPFYSRVYVFLDLLLAVPAAYGALVAYGWFRVRARSLAPLAGAVLVIAAAFPMFWLQKHSEASISPDIQETVRTLSALPKGSAVVTSPALLPWAHGWSIVEVHAPGIFKEPHATEEWNRYWSHAEPQFERAFLASFPQPAYILARPVEGDYVPECARELRPFLYDVDTCL
ncbi:MAG: hypothetical protein QOE22_500 [Candidatus Parcubacteria bacterium]|jgi:hypothetical protein|nr:hypothetical protein [Candidatus Parcubacteria bacterium]